MYKWWICTLFFLSCIHASYANSTYPFANKRQEAQFNHLLKDLRCLVCQNQDLADSNAELAQDLRTQVYRLVREHHSDSEVLDYMTSRYGDFILFKPPINTLTYLLWFGPFFFLMMGIYIFWCACLKKPYENSRFNLKG